MNSSKQDDESSCNNQKKRSLTCWTPTEERILGDLFSNHSNEYISVILNKTKASIARKASLLGLKKSKTHRQKIGIQNNLSKRHAWTEKEIVFLIDNYVSRSYEDIAEILNRTPDAVSQKARKMNLKKYRKTIKEIRDEANLKFPFIEDKPQNK